MVYKCRCEDATADTYDGYLQLENGVGMVRLLTDEVREALREADTPGRKGRISMVTGELIYPVISSLIKEIGRHYPDMEVLLYPIKNDFFGESITVTGLLTGGDIIDQLKGKDLGECLYLPQNMLRMNTEVFLDDVTVSELSEALHVPTGIVKSDGASLVDIIAGRG